MRLILFLLFWSISNNLFAQSRSRVESWTSYLPYQTGKHVTQSSEFVYFATDWSILKINKEDFSAERISKVEGLSDIGIRHIAFDSNNNQLLIAYNNSNIDIVRSNGVVNIPNILTNSDLTVGKEINAICFSNDEVFLATGFGIVNINAKSLIFDFTTFTRIAVNDIVTYQDRIYAATDEGIYFAYTDGRQNLIDFSQWLFLESISGLADIYPVNSLEVYKDNVYFESDGTLYSLDDNHQSSEIFRADPGFRINFLTSSPDVLAIGLRHMSLPSKVLFFNGNSFIEDGSSCSDRINGAVIDQFNQIWYADDFGGFRIASSLSEPCQRVEYNSPFSHEISSVVVSNGAVFVASGGVRDNYDYQFTRSGYYILNNHAWTNYNQDNAAFIKENDLLNFYTILPNPTSSLLYIGTYWGGLVEQELSEDSFSLYDDTNSSLRGTTGDEQRVRITGLHFDASENLWITSFGSPRPISVYTSEKEWFGFISPSNSNLIDIEIDDFGYLWIPAFGNNGGCVVYDPGADLKSSADDRYRFINAFNSELTTNVVNTVKVDLDGAIWLGTGEGPVIFDCGNNPFDSECIGNRIKVVQDSIVAFLLADQDIQSIEIDGGNQKWLGTRNGVFVQSPDGEEEVYRFSSRNSPLFDDRIRALAFDGECGEMYIGSDKGLQSFKTPSSSGSRFHESSKVYAFPNPVDPSYHGPITIDGLVKNAFVQITDINGKLVTELRALGGRAIWDGKGADNVEVKSGVYLVFSTDDNAFDRPDSFVTKVMIIR